MTIPATSDRPDSACCALIIPITEPESREHNKTLKSDQRDQINVKLQMIILCTQIHKHLIHHDKAQTHQLEVWPSG